MSAADEVRALAKREAELSAELASVRAKLAPYRAALQVHADPEWSAAERMRTWAAAQPGSFDVPTAAKACGISVSTAYGILFRAASRGIIRRVARGFYQRTAEVTP